MGRDKTQLLRLLFVDRKIREGMASGQLANCSSMAAEYEVSTKSILRDIDYLRNQRDAPIAYDDSRRGYYYTEEQYQLPAIDLNESDLFAICIAEEVLVRHENSPVYQRLRTVFDKIEASLPASVSVQPDWLAESLSVVPESQTQIDPKIWATVTDGLRKHFSLLILYERPGAEERTSRRFDPYHIVRCRGEWYLVGHCHLRDALRTLAVSRIWSVELLDQSFVVPDSFDPAVYRGGSFDIFGGAEKYRVRLCFDRNHAPYVMERQWHPEQEIQKDPKGGIVLAFPAADLHGVRQWVLSWGGGVRVLAPDVLAAMVQAELQSALAGYALERGLK